jgi:hypothetical protein
MSRSGRGFPVEIFLRIGAYCDDDTLRRLRSLNSGFASAFTKLAFQHVRFHDNYDSLNNRYVRLSLDMAHIAAHIQDVSIDCANLNRGAPCCGLLLRPPVDGLSQPGRSCFARLCESCALSRTSGTSP